MSHVEHGSSLSHFTFRSRHGRQDLGFPRTPCLFWWRERSSSLKVAAPLLGGFGEFGDRRMESSMSGKCTRRHIMTNGNQRRTSEGFNGYPAKIGGDGGQDQRNDGGFGCGSRHEVERIPLSPGFRRQGGTGRAGHRGRWVHIFGRSSINP